MLDASGVILGITANEVNSITGELYDDGETQVWMDDCDAVLSVRTTMMRWLSPRYRSYATSTVRQALQSRVVAEVSQWEILPRLLEIFPGHAGDVAECWGMLGSFALLIHCIHTPDLSTKRCGIRVKDAVSLVTCWHVLRSEGPRSRSLHNDETRNVLWLLTYLTEVFSRLSGIIDPWANESVIFWMSGNYNKM